MIDTPITRRAPHTDHEMRLLARAVIQEMLEKLSNEQKTKIQNLSIIDLEITNEFLFRAVKGNITYRNIAQAEFTIAGKSRGYRIATHFLSPKKSGNNQYRYYVTIGLDKGDDGIPAASSLAEEIPAEKQLVMAAGAGKR